MNVKDQISYFSNYGKQCIGNFALGKEITSACVGSSNQEENPISGTNISIPFITAMVSILVKTKSFSKL